MLAVDRGAFAENAAYKDSPQLIGFGVTISAPHMHAMRAAQPSTQFYVASDSAEAYAAVSAAFEPGVVASLHGEARGFNCTGAERRRLPCQATFCNRALGAMPSAWHTSRVSSGRFSV